MKATNNIEMTPPTIMYSIIGADGRAYGPVTFVTLNQWFVQGRVDSKTLVYFDGCNDWQPFGNLILSQTQKEQPLKGWVSVFLIGAFVIWFIILLVVFWPLIFVLLILSPILILLAGMQHS